MFRTIFIGRKDEKRVGGEEGRERRRRGRRRCRRSRRRRRREDDEEETEDDHSVTDYIRFAAVVAVIDNVIDVIRHVCF